MKNMLGLAAALLLMGQAPPPARADDLGWMSGHWQTENAGRWTEELWSAPRAGAMLGLSRTGREDVMREFEFLRIQSGADGILVYLAQPGGQAPVPFRLAARDGTSVTFENAQHDYPQRIRYARTGDSMVATISAIDGSNPMEWRYRRR